MDFSHTLLYFIIGYEFHFAQTPKTSKIPGMKVWTGADFKAR